LGLSKDRPSVDMSTARPLPALVLASEAITFGPGLPIPGLVPPLPFLPASTVFSAPCPAGLFHPAADHGVRHVSVQVDAPAPARHRACSLARELAWFAGRPLRCPGTVLPPLPRSNRPARSGGFGSSRGPARRKRRARGISEPARSNESDSQIRGMPPGCPGEADHRWRDSVPSPGLPRDAPPFGAFPSPTAVPRHRGPCPRAVLRRRDPVQALPPCPCSLRSSPTSRPCSVVESVAPRRVATARHPMLPWACVDLRACTRQPPSDTGAGRRPAEAGGHASPDREPAYRSRRGGAGFRGGCRPCPAPRRPADPCRPRLPARYRYAASQAIWRPPGGWSFRAPPACLGPREEVAGDRSASFGTAQP